MKFFILFKAKPAMRVFQRYLSVQQDVILDAPIVIPNIRTMRANICRLKKF